VTGTAPRAVLSPDTAPGQKPGLGAFCVPARYPGQE